MSPILRKGSIAFLAVPFTASILGQTLIAPGRPNRPNVVVTANLVTISWAAPQDGGAPSYYVLAAGTTPGGIDLGVHTVASGTAVTASVPNGVYFIRVIAVNAAGLGPASPEQSFTVGAGTAVPGAPGQPSATVNGSMVTISWGVPTTGGAPTRYAIVAGQSSGSSNLGLHDVGAVTTINATIAAGTYFIRVLAMNSAGAGPPSAESSFTVPQAPVTCVLRGLVREYASGAGDLDPVAGARVEAVSGPAAGRNATTSVSGEYCFEDLPAGTLQLRVTKAGFQNLETIAQVSSSTTTFNILVRRECSPWPEQVRDMMAKLSLPTGLCLIRQQNGRASNYHTQTRTVYLRTGSPVGGEIGSLSHELGHAHQHQAVLDAGISEPGFDDDFIPKWVSTREGTRFVQLTGWRHDPTANQHRPPFGWMENCERWSCGYQNPLEDAAEFTSNYYNVNNIFNRSDTQLQASAPNRFQWAREFLPK